MNTPNSGQLIDSNSDETPIYEEEIEDPDLADKRFIGSKQNLEVRRRIEDILTERMFRREHDYLSDEDRL